MTDLTEITIDRIGIEYVRIRDALRADMDAMIRRNAAVGKLGSGQTIIDTLQISETHFGRLRNNIITNAQRLVRESLWFSESDATRLCEFTEQRFAELYTEADQYLRKHAGHMKSRSDRIYGQQLPRLTALMKSAQDETMLEIESQVKIRIPRLVKGSIGFMRGLLGRLFTSMPP